MKRSSGVIAVDVGNTAVKLSLRPQGADANPAFAMNLESSCRSFALDRPRWDESIADWIRDQDCGETSLAPQEWRIASVNRRASDQLCKQVERSFPNATLRPISYRDVPMSIEIDSPDKVGIDRLLSAYAARNRYAVPLVVIDAGSAVTVDLVDASGCFVGGAILPGLNLQTTALTMGTAALPTIDWTNADPLTIPGRNTVQAIRLGVLTSVTASIDRLIAHYDCGIDGATPQRVVILCGGDAPVISPHIKHEHVMHPHLVCQGLLDLG